MKGLIVVLGISVLLVLDSCDSKNDSTTPVTKDITESVYASGQIKSKGQYEVYATVSGIVDSVYVEEGDEVEANAIILTTEDQAQALNKDNARLSLKYDAIDANLGRLAEAKQSIDVARSKMISDSLMSVRQYNLWKKSVGSKVEAEQRELAFQNAKLNYVSVQERYDNLKRQLELTASRSRNNLKLASQLKSDYTVRSLLRGKVYNLNVTKGEIILPQKPLAIIGDSKQFILEMQVDERDITSVEKGMRVVVSINSQRNQAFEALVTSITPFMNAQSKSFLVEAEFVGDQPVVYPNITFEANIVIRTKKNALLIPREYLVDESYVVRSNGDRAKVQTGLKDFNNVEILSGISSKDQLKKPDK
ncbi:MAG: efflux RND transporter periplasmic adaptor subunit [Ignavibacteria bacterium]|nr:efflux RND transporter periplasmic adaptor subunit [Ignavibacteria bacterium]